MCAGVTTLPCNYTTKTLDGGGVFMPLRAFHRVPQIQAIETEQIMLELVNKLINVERQIL